MRLLLLVVSLAAASCGSPCSTSEDCDAPLRCSAGACVQPECLAGADCASGRCIYGACWVEDQYCHDDSECAWPLTDCYRGTICTRGDDGMLRCDFGAACSLPDGWVRRSDAESIGHAGR